MGYILQILLSRHLNPVLATGAFILPTSVYFLLKVYCELQTLLFSFLFMSDELAITGRLTERIDSLIMLHEAFEKIVSTQFNLRCVLKI